MATSTHASLVRSLAPPPLPTVTPMTSTTPPQPRLHASTNADPSAPAERLPAPPEPPNLAGGLADEPSANGNPATDLVTTKLVAENEPPASQAQRPRERPPQGVAPVPA